MALVLAGTGTKGEFQSLITVDLTKFYILSIPNLGFQVRDYRRYAGLFQMLENFPTPGEVTQIFYDQMWLPQTYVNVRYDFGANSTFIAVLWYEDIELWELHAF